MSAQSHVDKSILEEFGISEQTVVNGILHTRTNIDSPFLESKYEFHEKLGQYFCASIYAPEALLE
jgi:hypothetical protein